jgi:putative MFS transporter
LGLAADIGEVALSNTFSAIFPAAPYHASRGEISVLLAAVFAGGAVGAPVFGWWGDRGGQRKALQTALAVVVLSSLAVAASPNLIWMTAFRFVSGLALGAYPPLTIAYTSDLMPPRHRGLLLMLCGAFAFLGAPAMIFLIRWLTPLAPLGIAGWRWALIAGAAVSAAAAVLFFLVPESPRWLAAVGRHEEAERGLQRFGTMADQVSQRFASEPQSDAVPKLGKPISDSGFAAIRREQRHRRRMILLAALYTLAPWAAIGFPLLSAAVMVQKGFRVSDSLLFAGLSMFGPTLGIGAAAFSIDRIERRLAASLCAAVMAAIGFAFAAATSLSLLIVLGAIFNLASAVYSAVLGLYGAELFPTPLRASATSGAWAVGRMVSIFVPIALLPLLESKGPFAMFALIASALLLSALLIAFAGPPGLTRRSVD